MLLLLLACAPATLGVGHDTATDGESDSAAPDDSAATDDSADTDASPDCGDIAPDDEGYADLFDATRIHTVALTVSDASAAALVADPDTYVEADLEIDGRAFPGVGVRWRGESAQERWDGKPGFRIGFRSFDGCDSLGGLSHLTLDAMVGDAAQGRAVVSYAAFAAAGLPAPRATYAAVTVNGESFGLYADVETVDGPFVARRWTEPGGVLWEGGGGADFTTRGLDEWRDVDSDGDDATLAAVAGVAGSAGDDFYTQADTLVDMDQFLGTWAMLAAIGHAGSYPYDTGDTYLYADPADGRFRFVAWGLDAGWDPAFGWNYVDGALGLRCVYDAACLDALRTHLDAALLATDALDVPGLASDAFAVSDSALPEDTRRGTNASAVRQARNLLLTTMAAWPAAMRAQIGG